MTINRNGKRNGVHVSDTITLHVPIGSPAEIDSKRRTVRLPAVSETGLAKYFVEVPVCVLKGLVGDLMSREGNNEATKLLAKAEEERRIVPP